MYFIYNRDVNGNFLKNKKPPLLSEIRSTLLITNFSCSDVLALPIFKQEESSLPPDNENKILPFQYVLCAATSPAVKLHDETLTYLNQGELHFSCQRSSGERLVLWPQEHVLCAHIASLHHVHLFAHLPEFLVLLSTGLLLNCQE